MRPATRAGILAMGLLLVIVQGACGLRRYAECRDRGFSVLYCLGK